MDGTREAPDLRVARIAANQFGVVSARQLAESGVSHAMVSRRVASGRLIRLHRGVYAVGHDRLRYEGRLVAALFACGPGAALSHRSAAAWWGIRPGSRRRVEVTVEARGGRRRQAGMEVHAVRRLDPRDVTRHERLPVTTVARTLVDLAAASPPRVVERALEQAYVLRLLAPGALEDALTRARGRSTRLLYTLMEARRPTTITASELEEAFLALTREAGLPDPEVNVPVAGYVVDFLWRERGLVIETDGYAAHGTRAAFERDRRRDVELGFAGLRVYRFTHEQVVGSPADTRARLRRLYEPQ